MSDFDFDLLNELIEDAPTAGYGPQVNFGKMVGKISVLHWDSGKPTETPYTNQKVSKPDYLRITFEADLSELNPMLTNPYKRRVDIRNSNKSGVEDKWTLTDWSETVKDNLVETLGKDWAKKLLKGFYAMWEDVPTVEKDKQGNQKGFTGKDSGKFYVNTVPRFLHVYKSKAECQIAREERFAKKENGSTSEAEADNGIPTEIISNVKGLIASVGLAQAETILASKPFGEYDVEELLKAANPL